MLRRFVLALGLVAALTGGAAAQNADWAGPYVGAEVGRTEFDAGYADAVFAGPVSDDAVQAGIVGGYAWQFGRWVLAPQARLRLGSAEGAGAQRNSGLGAVIRQDRSVSIDNAINLEAQVGYAVNKALIYASAGYVRADVDTKSSAFNETTNTLFTATVDRSSETHDGLSLGAGADYRLADKWALGVNYTHEDLGKERHDFATQVSRAIDVSTDTVSVRARYFLGR